MSFTPSYACDGPTCIEETRAESDSVLLEEGWLVLTRHEQPLDEHEEEQLDFCSQECLRAWLGEQGRSW